MSNQTPIHQRQAQEQHIRSIGVDILLVIITCGIFYFFIQYFQMKAVNQMVGYEKHNFLTWFLLTLVTCGIYHIYHEYVKSIDIATATGKPDTQVYGILALVLTFAGIPFIADAIQQSQINEYFMPKIGS